MKKPVAIAFLTIVTSFSSAAIAADDHAGHAGHVAMQTKAATSAPLTEGQVKKVDKAAGKITIAHGEIVNLNMPAMTMTFSTKTPTLLNRWKEGDKVRFRVEDLNGAMTIVSIEAAK